jgi:hypothetical protein
VVTGEGAACLTDGILYQCVSDSTQQYNALQCGQLGGGTCRYTHIHKQKLIISRRGCWLQRGSNHTKGVQVGGDIDCIVLCSADGLRHVELSAPLVS